MQKMEWLLDEVRFIIVDPTDRFFLPACLGVGLHFVRCCILIVGVSLAGVIGHFCCSFGARTCERMATIWMPIVFLQLGYVGISVFVHGCVYN